MRNPFDRQTFPGVEANASAGPSRKNSPRGVHDERLGRRMGMTVAVAIVAAVSRTGDPGFSMTETAAVAVGASIHGAMRPAPPDSALSVPSVARDGKGVKNESVPCCTPTHPTRRRNPGQNAILACRPAIA